MVRLSTAARISGLAFAFTWVGGCEGRTIPLGDGRTGTGGSGATGGSTGGGGSGGSATGGAIDGGTCLQHGQVKANEVLWIGDSWVQYGAGIQHTRVRDLAFEEGAIGPNDDYVVLAAGALDMAAIASTYDTQETTSTKVKVLIMDGGGWDTITGTGTPASVAETFRQLLARVATDGTVQHVIYFLYPELVTIPGVAAMRPLMKQACGDSKVPCHFLNLQDDWVGHPEYTDSSGYQASDAGAKVIADKIWETMQQNCIAQ